MCQLAISQPGSKAPFAMFHMNVSFSCLSPLSAVCQMSTGDGLWPACQHAALLFCSLYWTTIAEACSCFARVCVCVCVCASSLQERRVIILQFSHFSIYLQWLSLCNSDCIFVHGIWIYMIIYIYMYETWMWLGFFVYCMTLLSYAPLKRSERGVFESRSPAACQQTHQFPPPAWEMKSNWSLGGTDWAAPSHHSTTEETLL